MIETGVEKEDVRGLLSEVDVDSGGRPWTPGDDRGLRGANVDSALSAVTRPSGRP